MLDHLLFPSTIIKRISRLCAPPWNSHSGQTALYWLPKEISCPRSGTNSLPPNYPVSAIFFGNQYIAGVRGFADHVV